MEVYVLDEWLRRIEVIDLFESCVWTDRFNLAGDIDLTVEGTSHYRDLLQDGVLLACNQSDRIMMINQIDRGRSVDGAETINVKGVSAEDFYLKYRLSLSSNLLNSRNRWSFIGTPAWIIREMFKIICVWGNRNSYDKMPFYVAGNTYPADTIGEPAEEVTYAVEPQSLYQTFTDICAAYDLGFRIVRNQDWSELRFNVYAGNNRTTSQTTLPAVVFSKGMDNLQNTSEYESSVDYVNSVVVIHDAMSVASETYKEKVGIGSSFKRRVGFIDASSSVDQEIVDAYKAGGPPTPLIQAMVNLGQQELAKRRRLEAFDGEVNYLGNFVANVDYILGDIVELQNEYGTSVPMRVTEMIYASDGQGDRAYPTLALNKFYSPGTWQTWDTGQSWADAVPTWFDA